MIDWITCRVLPSSMPEFGTRIDTDKNGEIVIEKNLPEYIASSSTKIFVMMYGDELLISGNPSKYLLGHNIYAEDDWQIVEMFLYDLKIRMKIESMKLTTVTRLDITYSYLMPSFADVETALSELSKLTAEKWGKPVIKSGTVYFGTRQRQQLKIYNKHLEYKKHTKREDCPPLLRCELTLGRKHFAENDYRQYIETANRRKIWNEAMQRIRIQDIETLDINALPRNLQKVLGLWRMGADLRQLYASGTLYNYASQLRDYGVDIWAQPESGNVKQFRRTLQSQPLMPEHLQHMDLPLVLCSF